ncbi:MAG: hypothetical protein K8R91_06065, partial [Phycisphaerae bacterium]|nr:hypothetical protein [Phycisphaerae bacterium]
MKAKTLFFDILIVCFVFILGILINNIFQPNTDIPYGNSEEIISPSDWVKTSQINVYEDRVVLHLDNVRFVEIADTNSMDPVLDKGANAIEITDFNAQDINVGDIISFEIETGEIYIHRVVAKNHDSQGLYFITKGDNN